MHPSRPILRERDPAQLAVTYTLFIGLISLMGLAVMLSYYLLPLPEPVKQVLRIADTAICVPLLFDVLIRVRVAPHRKRYLLRSGWLDLLGSLPGLPLMRLFRLSSIARTARKLRETTSDEVFVVARRRLAESTLFVTTLALYVVVIAGSCAVVLVESRAPNGNIRTGGEAVWWAFVTLATVGFGDYYPVTTIGRVSAVMMMFGGIGLIGVITSYLATTFVERRGAAQDRSMEAMRAELAEIRALLDERRPPSAGGGDPGHARQEPPAEGS
jgi:voltage-gated potassium channel